MLATKLNRTPQKDYTSLVEVYLFRVTKIFFGKIMLIQFVSQQSEKDIFTSVVSFCEATFFYVEKFFKGGF